MPTIPPLSERPKSGFPVSISTGLALESIFKPVIPVADPDRPTPEMVAVGNYNTFIFNVATLLRNIIQSVPHKELIYHSQAVIHETLQEEIEYLYYLFDMHGLSASFYAHSYAHVKSTYGDKLRAANTDNQKYVQAIYDYSLSRLKSDNRVLSFKKHLEYPRDTSGLLLSHIPWDLLSHKSFIRLDLLESHTGTLKTRKTWNTKYFKIKDTDISFLPFVEDLLVTLGDSAMFHPAPIGERLALIEKLKAKNVHPLMDDMTYKLLMA